METQSVQVPVNQNFSPPTKPIQKGFHFNSFLLGAFMMALLGALGIYFFQPQFNKITTQVSPSPVGISTPDPTNNWKQISFNSLQFKIPPLWWNSEITQSNVGTQNQLSIMNINPSPLPFAGDAAPLFVVSYHPQISLIDAKKKFISDWTLADVKEETVFILNREVQIVQGIVTDGYFSNDQFKSAFIADDTHTYSLLTYDATQKDANYFDQILSTFSFAPQTPIETSKWQIYTDSKTGYSIKYPADWRKVEFDTGVGFGPKEIGEDVKWAVNYYDSKQKSIDDIIREVGSQFSDRKETREDITFNGLSGVKATITTDEYADWYAEIIVIQAATGINYSISNGAIKDAEFDAFYKSFQLF